MDSSADPPDQRIAVVGYAGRFPGAPDAEAFWQNLRRGVESITFFTTEELAAQGVDRAWWTSPNFVPAHPRIEGRELFDAAFFGYSAQEAEIIDPQQRLFLEVAWEALEHAGHPPRSTKHLVGVYAGGSQNTYLWFNLLATPGFLERHGLTRTITTNGADYLATRTSFKLNLRGPSVTVQAACSTSLVGVHLACQALQNFDCDIALAGGASLRVTPLVGYFSEPGGLLSRDGHCRPFDAAATGTVFGDGVGLVVLRRYEDAVNDGDTIHAVILGSAVTNDGSQKVGFTAPSPGGQAAAVFQALEAAGIDADTVSYLEAHGTGTTQGDPIEVLALTKAFRASTARRGFCALGSVKGNFGHLDAASGIAGMIKTILALEHGELPPTLHYTTPNPDIDFASTPFVVNTSLRPWVSAGPRRAGVNTFGMGGTNAHVILEEAPAVEPPTPDGAPQLLVLSARTTPAVRRAAAQLADFLRTHPEVDLADVAHTLSVGRHAFAHRLVVVARTPEEAAAALEGVGTGVEPATTHAGEEADRLAATGRAWAGGGNVDWTAHWQGQRRRRIPLPTYPFERQRYWFEPSRPPSTGAVDTPTPVAHAPSRHARPSLPVPYVAPRTEGEQRIVEVFEDLLGFDAVGVDDNFFELGGDSLLATRAIARLRSIAGRELPLRELLDRGTAAQLAALIRPADHPAPDAIPRRDPAQPPPLSYAQERLWFLHRLDQESVAYTLLHGVEYHGALEDSVIERALMAVVERHEILRTSFADSERGPVQRVHAAPPVGEMLRHVDCTTLPPERVQAEVDEVAREEFQRPFDLATGPLLRAVHVKLAADGHILLLLMHHIIADGPSLEQFVREFAACSAAVAAGVDPGLEPLSIQYGDYAAWQRQSPAAPTREAQLAYWTRQLAGVQAIALPTDAPRPRLQTFRGAAHRFEIPGEVLAGVRRLAGQRRATSFITLLAGFAGFLHRYCRQTDIAIGAPVANRTLPETERLIGLFANTIVLRLDCADAPSVNTLIDRARAVVLDAHAHQDVPFEQIVEVLQPARDLSRNPIFQVFFAYRRRARDEEEGAARALDLPVTATRFDLTVSFEESSDQLVGTLEYNTDLLAAETAARMARHLSAYIAAMVRDPQQSIVEVAILDPNEQQQILAMGTGPDAPLPASAEAASFPAAFARHAASRPEHPAVVCGGDTITYAQLAQQSERIAAELRRQGIGPGALVGLQLDRTPAFVACALAVCRAGAAYVPLDPTLPQSRLALMIDDARPAVVLGSSDVAAMCESDAPAAPDAPLEGDDLAYVIYTSGSTGRPKGVQVTHRALSVFLAAMRREPGIGAGDRLLAVTTFSFDIAGLELWLPLTSGATVVLASADETRDGRALAALLAVQRPTLMQATPSTWRLLFDAGWRNDEGVKILVGGEALPVDVARQLTARASDVWNLYGPTETTIWSTLQRVEQVRDIVPIGRPIAGTRVYVLDERLALLPCGVPGDLYIAGAGVARGYWDRAEVTADRFLPDPYSPVPGDRMYRTGDLARLRATGRFEFLGRTDDQVKLRGFRIELGEVEAAVTAHPSVATAVAALRADAAGEPSLVCWLVGTTDDPIDAAALRRFVQARLPDYMVPAVFAQVPALPLTFNGKIDRRALPDPERPKTPRTHTAPRTPTERRMIELWRDILGTDAIGADDDFFDLGGHSMLAARLLTRARDVFAVDLPLRALFEAPTPAGLSRAVTTLADGGLLYWDATAELIADSVLDPSIDAAGRPVHQTAPRRPLLTGATGFLGAHLLAALLESGVDEVICLIRCRDERDGLARVIETLQKYRLYREEFRTRLAVVPGELDRPRLGLARDQFAALGERADAIYHNGALVNFVLPYRQLRPANVSGTLEMLRLATAGQVKPFHYVSTMDVLGAGYLTTREDDPVGEPTALAHGYAQSKWVAERLVDAARDRGIPAAIYRPGRVIGHSQTAIWNTDDFACRAIRGALDLRAAPDLDPLDSMTPVDFVASAIVHISRGPHAFAHRAFHVISPQYFMWRRLFDLVQRRGYALEVVSYREWRRRLAGAADNALAPLLPLFPVPPADTDDGSGSRWDSVPVPNCEVTAAALAGSGLSCPPLDDALWDRYFSFLVGSNDIAPVGG